MGIPLLRGRSMHKGETHVVMLSESLARKRWPTEDPIGKEWSAGKNTVVGIVGNTRAMELNNSDATEINYPPTADSLPKMSILIRTAGAPDGLSPTIRQIAISIDPRLFPTITPLKVGFTKSIGQVEQVAMIISSLGSIAIFLAVVGLLGLVTYAVSQRTKEIAIRLALGASHTEICLRHLASFRMACPRRIVRRSSDGLWSLADHPPRPLRHQRPGPDQLSRCHHHPHRNPRSSCPSANPTSLRNRHRKNPSLRLEQRRRWRIAACALLFVVPEGNLRLQPLPHKQNCHRRPVFRPPSSSNRKTQPPTLEISDMRSHIIATCVTRKQRKPACQNENKLQNRGVFFRPEKVAAEAPHSPHNPPQIHHVLPSKKHHKIRKTPSKNATPPRQIFFRYTN